MAVAMRMAMPVRVFVVGMRLNHDQRWYGSRAPGPGWQGWCGLCILVAVLRPLVAALLAAAILSAVPAAANARVRISVPPRPRDAAALERIKSRLDSRLPPTAPRAVASPRAGIFSSISFAGLAAVQNPAFAQDTPPDPTGSIGQNDYVELVNSKIGVYRRSDLALVSSNNLQAFIADNFVDNTFVEDGGPGSPGEDVFDIQIQWDEQADRWLFAADDVSPSGANHLVFGWSKSDDAENIASGWCMYRTAGTTAFDDYPKLGHNNTQLLIGVNRFSDFEGGLFQGAHVWSVALPAAGTITNCSPAPTPVDHSLGTSVFTPVPANVTDAAGSATGYVVAADSAPDNQLRLFTVDAAGSVSGPALISVPSYSIPPNVRQPGTAAVLDSQDGRLTQAVAHADPARAGVEAIWTQHTVASADGQRSQLRWYELDPGSTTPLQVGSVADASNFVFNGAVSPASNGTTAAVQYNVGGRFHLVDLRGQTRVSTDGDGTLRDEVSVAPSSAVDADFTCVGGPCRWGDYAGASPDPKIGNEGVVWATGQLNGSIQPDQNPSWITQNFALEDDGPDATAPDTTIDVGGFLTSDTTPAFQFASSETGSIFECSLDGGSFSACTPGATFGPALADGTHTLDVRATDPGGNTDASPAHTTFTIDSTPPDTAFDFGPKATITVNAASFGFHSSEPGSTFQCSFDGGSFTACASPFNATALPLGSHALSVRAIDPVGNVDPTPAAYGFAVVPVTPPPPASPSVSVKSQRLARNGRVSLRVRCPAGRTSSCVGTVTLQASVSGKARTVRLGRARFRISSGTTSTVRIKLGKSARKLLARKTRLRVKATFRFTSPAKTMSKSFSLLAPRRRR
jgi:hypothetical protein